MFIKKTMLIICLLLLPNVVCAYENDYFSIDIPDTYKELEQTDNTYVWESNNAENSPSIFVTIEKNPATKKQNVDKFTKTDLEDYKKTIENSIATELSEYDITVQVSDLEITKLNDYSALTYTATWPTKDSFGYDMYQKNYVITTENYITTLTYSTTTEEAQTSSEAKTLLKSFKINDSEIKLEGFFDSRRNQIIVVSVIAGILGYIISAIIKRKKGN